MMTEATSVIIAHWKFAAAFWVEKTLTPGSKFSVMQKKTDAEANVSMPGVVATADLVGRVLLAQLFIIEAVTKLSIYGAAADYVASYGLPRQLLPLAIAVELGGGLFLLLGWQVRLVSLVFTGFCLATATIFHNDFANRNEFIHFQKDLALAGAFLILCVRGAGAFSFDAWSKSRQG
jgi:putative oxidoreductase